MRLFARCVRGTEWLAAAELRARLGARIVARGHREVRFETDGPLEAVLDTRTVDDLFLQVGSLDGLDHTRASLARLSEEVARLDLVAAVETVRAVRPLAGRPASEVSASFLGRRNYNRYDLEDVLGQVVAAQLGGRYRSRRTSTAPGAPLSWRVHLVDDRALVGLRLADRPLHRRAYKRHSLPGTLHPPLAAALALLCGLRPGAVLLDPFCGAGTVVIEAAGFQAGTWQAGLDISAPAVAGAAANGRAAGVAASWLVGDAGNLPVAAGSVHRVVSNAPWHRQVALEGAAAGDARRCWSELARVAAPGARMVLLLDDLEQAKPLAAAAGLGLVPLGRVSLSGRHPAVALAGHDTPTEPLDRAGLYGPELAGELDAATGR